MHIQMQLHRPQMVLVCEDLTPSVILKTVVGPPSAIDKLGLNFDSSFLILSDSTNVESLLLLPREVSSICHRSFFSTIIFASQHQHLISHKDVRVWLPSNTCLHESLLGLRLGSFIVSTHLFIIVCYGYQSSSH